MVADKGYLEVWIHMGFVSRRLPFSANILADVYSCRAFLPKREEAEDISISANTFCFQRPSARVTKYEHYYVFVSGVLGLVVMKPDKK